MGRPNFLLSRPDGRQVKRTRSNRKRKIVEAGHRTCELAERNAKGSERLVSAEASAVPVTPLQKPSKRRSTMAVLRFLFRSKFRERFLDLGKIKHRVVSEATGSLQMVENPTFCDSMKSRQRSPVAGSRDHTHKTSGALFRGDIL